MSSSTAGTDFQAAASKSTRTFLSALFVSLAVAGIEFAVFVALRPTIKKVYAPRTYLPVPSKRTATPAWTPWGFILPVLRTPSTEIIAKNGLDAYMFIRFLKMMIYIFGPTTLFTWAVLLPTNAIGTDVSTQGLNAFAFGNIPPSNQGRYWAHLVCAYAVCFWVFFLLYREAKSFIRLRQEYLVSANYVARPQARTVLVTGVPSEYLSKSAILRLTARLPGGVRQVWISRALGDLPHLYGKRLDAAKKLESAETALCKTALKIRKKEEKKRGKAEKRAQSPKARPSVESGRTPVSPNSFATGNDTVNTHADAGLLESNPSLAERLVPTAQRPHHRLGFLGRFGPKVDTIDHCKKEIVNLTKQLEEGRAKVEEHPPHNSVFIQFEEQMAAHLFAQAVVHHEPLRMANKYVDVAPEDIIHDNLNMNPYDLRIRNAVVWAITIGLIILWSFPVAFVGVVSNLSSLCVKAPWLAWMCRLPQQAQGVIQGVLPPLLLMILFLLLPIVFRLLGRYSGIPRRSDIELSLMSRYYPFLVVHGFLVMTLASGLTVAIPEIAQNPGEAVTILTQNLPKASIFFMTYMVTSTLTGSAGTLLSIVDLLIYYLKVFVLSSTPRSIFNVRYHMTNPDWGTLWPNTTLLTTIALAYAVIAPIMSGLALLGFSLFWFAYKHQFLYVSDFPTAQETGGLYFRKALSHVFIGVYIMELCLTGLFFIARNENREASSIPQGILMVVLLVITMFYHRLIYVTYRPLSVYLPLDLDEKREAERGQDGVSQSQAQEMVRDDSGGFTDDPESLEMRERGKGGNADRKSASWGDKRRKERSLSPRRKKQEERKSKSWPEPGFDEQVEEPGRFAFLHPAIWEPIRPIWVPNDPLGIGKDEVEDLKKLKIPASTAGAGITAGKGEVFVTRSPPENVEVIELSRTEEREGLFALPGAIGAGAIKAARRVGAETRDLKSDVDERLRRTRTDRPRMFGRKPPKAASNHERMPSSLRRRASNSDTNNSDTDFELRSRGTTEGAAASSSPEVDIVDRRETGEPTGVAAGAALPGPPEKSER